MQNRNAKSFLCTGYMILLCMVGMSIVFSIYIYNCSTSKTKQDLIDYLCTKDTTSWLDYGSWELVQMDLYRYYIKQKTDRGTSSPDMMLQFGTITRGLFSLKWEVHCQKGCYDEMQHLFFAAKAIARSYNSRLKGFYVYENKKGESVAFDISLEKWEKTNHVIYISDRLDLSDMIAKKKDASEHLCGNWFLVADGEAQHSPHKNDDLYCNE